MQMHPSIQSIHVRWGSTLSVTRGGAGDPPISSVAGELGSLSSHLLATSAARLRVSPANFFDYIHMSKYCASPEHIIEL